MVFKSELAVLPPFWGVFFNFFKRIVITNEEDKGIKPEPVPVFDWLHCCNFSFLSLPYTVYWC